MRALEFKIRVDSLVLRNYQDSHREDLDFVTRQAAKNHLTWELERENLIFNGKHEDLFTFLYDVAYRYDIELM